MGKRWNAKFTPIPYDFRYRTKVSRSFVEKKEGKCVTLLLGTVRSLVQFIEQVVE